MYSRTLLDILFLIWGQTVADYRMLSFHLSINVIIIVVSFKILDLCPIAVSTIVKHPVNEKPGPILDITLGTPNQDNSTVAHFFHNLQSSSPTLPPTQLNYISWRQTGLAWQLLQHKQAEQPNCQNSNTNSRTRNCCLPSLQIQQRKKMTIEMKKKTILQ